MGKLTQVSWQEPPAVSKKRRTKTDPLIRAVRKNPDKWLVYARNMSSGFATHLRRKYPDLEIISRKAKYGKGSDVFIRFVPQQTDTATNENPCTCGKEC